MTKFFNALVGFCGRLRPRAKRSPVASSAVQSFGPGAPKLLTINTRRALGEPGAPVVCSYTSRATLPEKRRLSLGEFKKAGGGRGHSPE